MVNDRNGKKRGKKTRETQRRRKSKRLTVLSIKIINEKCSSRSGKQLSSKAALVISYYLPENIQKNKPYKSSKKKKKNDEESGQNE